VDCRKLPPEEQPKKPRPVVEDEGGPRSRRCSTHLRARRVHRKAKLHATYVKKTYGLPEGFYDALREHQDGKCAGCQRATGASKRLAVDHDHKKPEGSIESVRGLLCATDNWILRAVRDDPEHLRRLARYLETPPAQTFYVSWTP
jgi:hypothetical protein